MNPKTDLHKHLTPGSTALKVLHIGNIANNGYNIANLFNQAGVQSDLLIGPYYHIAGCPEWEDSEFDGDIGDQFFPEWHKVKITNGFQRPRWAAQGPWEVCISYLLHRNRGNKIRARLLWFWMGVCRRAASSGKENKIKISLALGSPKKVGVVLASKVKNIQHLTFWHIKNILYLIFWKLKNTLYLAKYHLLSGVLRSARWALLSNDFTSPLFYRLREIRRQYTGFYDNKPAQVGLDKTSSSVKVTTGSAAPEVMEVAKQVKSPEPYKFPYFEEAELVGYQALADQLQPLFDYYDVVVGYSTDGIWPLLAGKKYLAYEHGTIRTLPFEDSLQGRLCKLVYQEADQVIISNFDNDLAAKKLGLQRYTCIPHYINEMDVGPEQGAKIRAKYKSTHNADFIVYNPSRQHWSVQKDAGWEKGNDIFIRGFARFVKEVNENALVIMTHWGESLQNSKRLIADLGIERNVDWVEPVPHKQMIQYIHASHVVSDQFLLGTFGGIPAKAFMHAKPVLSSFDPLIHEWCFKTMPPFLPARSEADIKESLDNCYKNDSFYSEVAQKSQIWYQNEHSNEVLLSRMSRVLLNTVN